MKIDLTGQKAIVCGGAEALAAPLRWALRKRVPLFRSARGAEALDATRAEIMAAGVTAHAASVDLGKADAIKAYIHEAAGVLGGVDILVNNASAFGSADTEDGWVSSLMIDMLAIVHATQAALPFLTEAKGSVINTSSISAMRAAAAIAYGAIKAAVIHYTNTQAAMYARSGIRVNGIAPGSIEFPGGVWDRRKTENPALHNAVLKSIPFGRLGYPEEVANVAVFLASPLALWGTGQTIVVDGGQLL